MAARPTTESVPVHPWWGAWLASAALFATLCVLLWDSLFGGKVLTQADALYQFAPWSKLAAGGFRPSNELLLDQSTGFLPWLHFQAESVAAGELPLWNPYNYCGEPLVGTYQSAFYWPLNWIYYAWPSWHAHAWIALVRLWLAGFFTFLFLRRLGMGNGPASIGGLGYMLSGFMVVWLNHPHVSAALFLPAMLWSVERVTARPSRGEAVLFGLLFGLQLLAGHIQTSLHLSIFTAAYALFQMVVGGGGLRRRAAALMCLLTGLVLGTCLAAPQLLPFFEYLSHSQAAEVFESMETVARGGVTPAAILMVDPTHFGGPHTHDYSGPTGPNLNYNELIGGYVGRVLVLLALLQAMWVGWRRRSWAPTLFFVVVVVVSGLVAFQVEPVYSFFASIPRLRSTKLMRVLQFVAFGLAVLGAMGLDRMLRRNSYRRPVLVAVFVLIAVEQLWFAHGYNPQVDPGILVPKTEVTRFLRANQGFHRTLGVDNSILKPNANVFYRISMVSGYDSMEDKALTELALRMASGRPEFPFLSQVGAFTNIQAFPLMCLFGVRYFLATGPLPAPLRKVLDAEVLVYENPQVMPRAFLARHVEVITDPAKRLDYLSSASFDPWNAVVERAPETPIAGATDPGDRVEMLRHAPREVLLRVNAARRSLLVLTDVWDRGWSVRVNGTSVPIERVDHAFRGVLVPAGESQVRFRYDPLSTKLGLALATLAFLSGGVLLFTGWRRRRRPVPADSPE